MGSEKCSPAVQAFSFLFELISQCYCSVFVAFLLWISPWKDLAFVVRLFCNLAHLSGVCWGRPAPHPQKIQGDDLRRARARSSKERRGWRWRGRQPSITAASSNVQTSLTECFISKIDFVLTTIQLRILQSSPGSRMELGSCQWRFRLEMILRGNDFNIYNVSWLVMTPMSSYSKL